MKYLKRLTVVAAIIVSLNVVGLILSAANASADQMCFTNCTPTYDGGQICTTMCY